MAELTADEMDDDAALPPPKKRLSGRTLVLFIILPALLILGGGGAGAAYFLGFFGGKDRAAHVAEEAKPQKPKVTVFYDLPEILVNLNATGRQASYLKLRVSLEVEDAEQVKAFEKLMPRVLDNFQIYLREIRPDELSGSAGLFRLKEELLVRVNAAVAPIKINDVLFKEMLLQ